MTDSGILALHNQDLVDVMVEADRCGSPYALILHDLAEHGYAYPLDEEELGPLRQKGKAFEGSIWNSPILTEFTSPKIEPDTNQVKETLLNDIAGDDVYSFAPSHGSRSEDALAISNLINNIDNPRYNKSGFVSSLHSPELERIYQYTPDWDQDGILGMSRLTIEVTPADSTQDIEFSDSYMHSTLVTGSKIWLVFRPTSNNMAVLQAYYDTVLNGTENHALDHARNFEPGIIFIQRPGETLLLPPFWMATVVSVQPTVSATFYIATAIEFEERVKQLRNFRSTMRLHLVDDREAQRMLFTFTDELIEHLRAILEGSFPECDLNKVISNICRDYETFRADLRRLLGAIEDRAVVQGLEAKYQAAWINFLEMKRKKTRKPTCRVCNLRIEYMPVGTSPMDRLRQHFIEFHCLRSVRSIERIRIAR